MITAHTRANLAEQLRTGGTLSIEPQAHTITRAEASQLLVEQIDDVLIGTKDAGGTPWLIPSSMQQVLP